MGAEESKLGLFITSHPDDLSATVSGDDTVAMTDKVTVSGTSDDKNAQIRVWAVTPDGQIHFADENKDGQFLALTSNNWTVNFANGLPIQTQFSNVRNRHYLLVIHGIGKNGPGKFCSRIKRKPKS